MRLHDVIASLWMVAPRWLRTAYQRLSGSHSFASRLLPDRVETVEIKGGTAKGMKMRLNLQRERSFYFGTYEEDVQSILLKHVREGMTVYNVGAHIGFFTLGLSRRVRSIGKVIAFEPNSDVRMRLIEHVTLNSIEDRIHIEECALSDFDGTANFSLSLSDTQGRFEDLPYVKPGSVIQVCCKRLDTYISEGGPIPDFVLMDVEHAEGRVLRGMFRIMEDYKPLILLEMHGPASITEAWHELKKHNYSVAHIPDLRGVDSPEDITYGHYLAVPHIGLDR